MQLCKSCLDADLNSLTTVNFFGRSLFLQSLPPSPAKILFS